MLIPVKFSDAELDFVNYSEMAGNGSCSFTNNFDGTASYSCAAPLPLGELSSTITATDSRGDSCNATLTVNVSDAPGNLPPVANNDNLGAVVTQAYAGSGLESVLDNDSDPEGETLLRENLAIVAQPSVGEIVLVDSGVANGDKELLYTGPVSSDTYSFSYTVADSLAAVSNVATVAFEPSDFVSNGAFVGPAGEPRTVDTYFYAYEPLADEVTTIGSVPDWGQAATPPLFVSNYSGTPAQQFYAQVSPEALIDQGLDVAAALAIQVKV